MMLLLVALMFMVMVIYYSYNILTGDDTSEDVGLSCLAAALMVGALFAEMVLWLNVAGISRADGMMSLCLVLTLFGVMVLAALLQLALVLGLARWLDARRRLAGR